MFILGCICNKRRVMLQVRRGGKHWQRKNDEQLWEMGLPKGEIKGLKQFEKLHTDSGFIMGSETKYPVGHIVTPTETRSHLCIPHVTN